jgi:transcriptional regulator with XRE-family HTH domain
MPDSWYEKKLEEIELCMRLKDRRFSLGMTLQSFCNKHNLDVNIVSAIERGELCPMAKPILEKYVNALGEER